MSAASPRGLDAPRAETSLGPLRGATEDGCAVFRRVPYAAPPVGPLRFAPAETPRAWTGVLDCTVHGPIAPQPPSDLRHYMGDFDRPQDEDCLTLTIWTPAIDDRTRPVLLWFHGGAFVSGAGSLDWYAGSRLALAGDVVVVHANYRLGALGWLCWPGLADGNFALTDQAEALRWVARHIAAFGGDPDTITVGGQSAGASTTGRLLLLDEGTRPPIRRALLQSGGFGRTPTTREDAMPTVRAFCEALGIDPDRSDAMDALRRATVPDILRAQLAAERLGFTLPVHQQAWRPVFEERLTSADYAAAVGAAAAAQGIDLLIGFTGDEGHAFVGGPIPAAPDPAMVEARFLALTGDPHAIERYRASLPGCSDAELLADLTSDYQFARGSLEVADAAAAGGSPVHVYLFDWAPAGSRFGAGHCLDLAFVFGAWPSWAGAPMLEGGDPVRMEALGGVVRAAIAGFVRTGDPVGPGTPPWPAYGLPDRTVLRFGRRIAPVRDAGGQRWL